MRDIMSVSFQTFKNCQPCITIRQQNLYQKMESAFYPNAEQQIYQGQFPNVTCCLGACLAGVWGGGGEGDMMTSLSAPHPPERQSVVNTLTAELTTLNSTEYSTLHYVLGLNSVHRSTPT